MIAKWTKKRKPCTSCGDQSSPSNVQNPTYNPVQVNSEEQGGCIYENPPEYSYTPGSEGGQDLERSTKERTADKQFILQKNPSYREITRSPSSATSEYRNVVDCAEQDGYRDVVDCAEQDGYRNVVDCAEQDGYRNVVNCAEQDGYRNVVSSVEQNGHRSMVSSVEQAGYKNVIGCTMEEDGYRNVMGYTAEQDGYINC